ncbi:MAG: ATP-binding cassette domain-containing protein, partial [Patescibacteria group bacterium]|nr:ATP-binding cassette domain-containing protein [Patescibacteria group bacterium]
MGQKSQLWEDLPAYEGFVLNQAIYELDDATFRANLDELVATLDVRDILHVQTRKLSLGQRMKCELIAALLHNPRVLFLDEPTIGLDVVAQQNMREFIKKYNRQQKTTILLTSHYMEDIKELCERIIIINLGRIIYDGPLKALINKYATHKVLTITFNQGGASHGELARYGEVDYQSPFHSIVSVPRSEATAVASALLSSGLPVDDILIDEPNIDDVIRQIFQNAHARS